MENFEKLKNVNALTNYLKDTCHQSNELSIMRGIENYHATFVEKNNVAASPPRCPIQPYRKSDIHSIDIKIQVANFLDSHPSFGTHLHILQSIVERNYGLAIKYPGNSDPHEIIQFNVFRMLNDFNEQYYQAHLYAPHPNNNGNKPAPIYAFDYENKHSPRTDQEILSDLLSISIDHPKLR